MSSPAPLAEAAPTVGHDPSGHEHPAHLAHHFESSEQQFDSGKLGIWLFLTTEVLLFAGLFCAYAACRAHNYDVLRYAHHYLSVPLGALNTAVLIFSSFTMAWAVRCSQLGKTKSLCILLTITLLCGLVFLCVKFVEYQAKFRERLLPGTNYRPTEGPPGSDIPEVQAIAAETKTTTASVAMPPASTATAAAPKDSAVIEHSQITPAPAGAPGISKQWLESEKAESEKKTIVEPSWVGPEPDNVQLFFGIYFAMTGLHGLHVIAGMGAIFWVLMKARRGEFGPDYFEPVDFVGLYWHLVDLVWIFLFPLLYLIT